MIRIAGSYRGGLVTVASSRQAKRMVPTAQVMMRWILMCVCTPVAPCMHIVSDLSLDASGHTNYQSKSTPIEGSTS